MAVHSAGGRGAAEGLDANAGGARVGPSGGREAARRADGRGGADGSGLGHRLQRGLGVQHPAQRGGRAPHRPQPALGGGRLQTRRRAALESRALQVCPTQTCFLFLKFSTLWHKEFTLHYVSQGTIHFIYFVYRHANVLLCTFWEPEVTQKQCERAFVLLRERLSLSDQELGLSS